MPDWTLYSSKIQMSVPICLCLLLNIAFSTPVPTERSNTNNIYARTTHSIGSEPAGTSFLASALLIFSYLEDNPAVDSTELPLTATIENGTLAHIQRRGSDFLYCSISDASVENLHDYKIVWVDPKGKRVGSYRCGNVRRRRCSQFTIDTDGVPYSYLTLVDFRRAFQGKYTCELWHRRDRVGSAQVLVQMADWF